MIQGLLAGAAQLGLVGPAIRRAAMRLAAGVATALFAFFVLLIAVVFAAISAYLALADFIPAHFAALAVAGGLAAFAGMIVLIAWLSLRDDAPKARAPLARAGGATSLHMALSAFGAGMAAGSTLFRRR